MLIGQRRDHPGGLLEVQQKVYRPFSAETAGRGRPTTDIASCKHHPILGYTKRFRSQRLSTFFLNPFRVRWASTRAVPLKKKWSNRRRNRFGDRSGLRVENDQFSPRVDRPAAAGRPSIATRTRCNRPLIHTKDGWGSCGCPVGWVGARSRVRRRPVYGGGRSGYFEPTFSQPL